MQQRLQRKIQEVSSLLVEMGDIPAKAAAAKKGRRRTSQMERASAEQEWRNRQSAAAAVSVEASNEGRLPAIQEDKLYPRRTLENAELVALLEVEQASESPELGPPPVAHFDVADPIAFDAARYEEGGENTHEGLLHPAVEKRRKRRTSALLQDMPTEEEQESQTPAAPPQLLKSGAKRKLDVSELEESSVGVTDEFVFHRRQDLWNNATASGKKASRFTRPPGRENETAESSPQKNATTERKILAPKSTNSPAKRKVMVSEKEGLKDSRDDRRDDRPRPTARRSNNVPLPALLPPPETQSNETNDLPPKTPAVSDMLSPVSTEPSVRTTHQAKEAAILSSVEDVLNGSIGRGGSRRARPAVSYALPNLRDKMRRPGKELVGAVEGIEKHHQARGTSEDRDRDRAARSESVPNTERVKVNIKREKDADQEATRWKELPHSAADNNKEDPTSPLKDKEKAHVNATRLDRDRRRTNYSDELEKAVDQLSIFDGPVSSPAEESAQNKTGSSSTASSSIGSAATTTATKRRTSSTTGTAGGRRHSTQTSSSSAAAAALDPAPQSVDAAAAATDHPSAKSSTSRVQLPRPSSVASMRQASGSTTKDLKRSSSVSSSLRAASIDSKLSDSTNAGASTDTNANANANAGASRSERVSERTSNRRRSMMV